MSKQARRRIVGRKMRSVQRRRAKEQSDVNAAATASIVDTRRSPTVSLVDPLGFWSRLQTARHAIHVVVSPRSKISNNTTTQPLDDPILFPLLFGLSFRDLFIPTSWFSRGRREYCCKPTSYMECNVSAQRVSIALGFLTGALRRGENQGCSSHHPLLTLLHHRASKQVNLSASGSTCLALSSPTPPAAVCACVRVFLAFSRVQPQQQPVHHLCHPTATPLSSWHLRARYLCGTQSFAAPPPAV